MPSLFPTSYALQRAFEKILPSRDNKNTSTANSKLARPELYTAWSVADDAKNKAAQLGDAAMKELNKTGAAMQPKTGKIELYSAQYYQACVFGGMMACVRISCRPNYEMLTLLGPHPLGCHPS